MIEKKSKSFTIYKSPAIERVLEARPNDPVSGRLSQVCDRYRHICLSSMPDITDDELMMIGNALTGTFIDPLTVDNLHQDIADERDDSDPTNPLPEYVELAEKVRNWTVAQKYAVLEALKI